jgi:hypothetical protein
MHTATAPRGVRWTEDELLMREVRIAAVVEEEVTADRRNRALAERHREKTLISTEDVFVNVAAYRSEGK